MLLFPCCNCSAVYALFHCIRMTTVKTFPQLESGIYRHFHYYLYHRREHLRGVCFDGELDAATFNPLCTSAGWYGIFILENEHRSVLLLKVTCAAPSTEKQTPAKRTKHYATTGCLLLKPCALRCFVHRKKNNATCRSLLVLSLAFGWMRLN